MSVNLTGEAYWSCPYLLAGGDKQYYIYPETGHRWLWREKKGGDWEEAETLSRRGEKLCAALDARREPHLVALDGGSFYHLRLQDDRFSETLFYREEGKQCSHLLLAGDARGELHLVYLAVDSHAARWWLLHHRHGENGWEEPRVIDFGGGAALNYGSITLDRDDNLHLVYRIGEENRAGLYYRYFNPLSVNWSKALHLAAAAEISHPLIIADRSQNLHVVWAAARESGYLVNYRAMVRESLPAGGWKPETAVSPPLPQKPFPLLSSLEGRPAMGWFDGGSLTLYRYSNGGWERGSRRHVEAPRLIRCNVFGPPDTPLLYWHLVGSEVSLPPAQDLFHAFDEGGDNLDADFKELQQSSQTLVKRASDLSTAKTQLEQTLEQKDRDLQRLEEKLKQATQNLKSKTEQARRVWEEEKKRYRNDLQSLMKERRRFNQILSDKENTIAKLEARCREQEFTIKNLVSEKEALSAQLRDRGWSVKKLLGKLLHNKP